MQTTSWLSIAVSRAGQSGIQDSSPATGRDTSHTQQPARRHTHRRAALLGGLLAGALAGCAGPETRRDVGGTPVAQTVFDRHFSRIGQTGQSPCLDFAGSNFLAMREAGQQARFVIGRWTGRNGESLHAWVEDSRGGIVDFQGMGGPERYRPLASWDGEKRYAYYGSNQ